MEWIVEAEDVGELLDGRFTVQTKPLVRCKDCKHLFSDNECPLRTWRTHVDDDFCSYGERADVN